MSKFNKSKVDKTKDVLPPFRIVTDEGETDVTIDEALDYFDEYDYDDYDDYYDEWLDEDEVYADAEEAAKEQALRELEDLARKIRATEGD